MIGCLSKKELLYKGDKVIGCLIKNELLEIIQASCRTPLTIYNWLEDRSVIHVYKEPVLVHEILVPIPYVKSQS